MAPLDLSGVPGGPPSGLSSGNGRCGTVAVIGRPSSGKSTLVNRLCGGKVSIVSPAPQTTRNSIRGIANFPGCQLIFIDTPGYHNSARKMNLRLQTIAKERLAEADCVLYVLDTTRPPGPEEQAVAELVAPFSARTVVALNKTDCKTASPGMARLYLGGVLPDVPPGRIFVLSAETGEGTDALCPALAALAPEGPPLYPPEFYTDQEVDFRIAEIIREKVMQNTRGEIPHAVYVEVADMEPRRHGKELFVRAFLVAERGSQKAMLIGKDASMIRRIKAESLADFRRIFPFYVILDLQVRVNKNWRQQDSRIGRFR